MLLFNTQTYHRHPFISPEMVVTGHDLLGRFIRTLAENGFPEKDFELLAVALTSFPTELHLETEFIKIDDLPLPTTPNEEVPHAR